MSGLLSNLKNLAVKTIEDCTFDKMFVNCDAPVRILLPAGNEKYLAFWIRDTAMMAESHLISNNDLLRYVSISAAYGQNGSQTRYLKNGLIVPPYALTDHINYNGKAVYFPGDYKDGDDQGDGTWGSYPPFCDNYYFITMVEDYVSQSGDWEILNRSFSGMALKERLEKAMEGYNINPETGLCVSHYARHTVDWGFTDSVAMQGQLLFASLLRYEAAGDMNHLFPGVGYDALQEKLKKNIIDTFYDAKTGWWFSSDGVDRQHDVWGSAYAVYLGLVKGSMAKNTAFALARAYKEGRSGINGYIRHILEGEDAMPGVNAWARCGMAYNTYQNGAYWATPLGWYSYAVSLVDRELAIAMLKDFMENTRERASEGAPFEYTDRDGSNPSGMLYGTSGVLPYVAASRFVSESD